MFKNVCRVGVFAVALVLLAQVSIAQTNEQWIIFIQAHVDQEVAYGALTAAGATNPTCVELGEIFAKKHAQCKQDSHFPKTVSSNAVLQPDLKHAFAQKRSAELSLLNGRSELFLGEHLYNPALGILSQAEMYWLMQMHTEACVLFKVASSDFCKATSHGKSAQSCFKSSLKQWDAAIADFQRWLDGHPNSHPTK